MAELYHQVWITAPSATVYEAISSEAGIAGWWDTPKAVTTDSGVNFAWGEALQKLKRWCEARAA